MENSFADPYEYIADSYLELNRMMAKLNSYALVLLKSPKRWRTMESSIESVKIKVKRFRVDVGSALGL